MTRSTRIRAFLAGLAAVGLTVGTAKAGAPCCPPKEAAPAAAAEPKTVTIKATVEEPPSVIIKLGARCAKAVPVKGCCDHTGGGNIDVQQPTPDVLVITMTGAAVAAGSPVRGTVAGFDFDLSQCFNVSAEKPDVKAVKITMDARLVGALRSHKCCGKCSTAEVSAAHAGVTCDHVEGGDMVSIALPPHTAACGENVSINDKEGPICQIITPGCYTLHQGFHIQASHPKSVVPCKASAAEFADAAIDPLWLSYKEPFRGVAKKDFGFQVIIKVEADDSAPAANGNGNGKKEEKLPPPKESKPTAAAPKGAVKLVY
jgi:hypothetical protein